MPVVDERAQLLANRTRAQQHRRGVRLFEPRECTQPLLIERRVPFGGRGARAFMLKSALEFGEDWLQ